MTDNRRMTLAGSMAAASFACAFAPAASAQADDWITPSNGTYTLKLGGFLPAFRAEVRVNNKTLGSGSGIDLKDDLGVKSTQSGGFINAEWRFAKKHRLGFEYSQFSPSGSVVAKKDIQIGDEIYPAGATLSTKFQLRLVPITYSYSFIRNERQELSGTIGLNWQRVRLQVSGSGSLGEEDFDAEVAAKADLPLPVLGLRWDYNISDRWSAGLQASAFSVSVVEAASKAKGTIFTGGAYGEYRFAANIGVGLALTALRANLDVNDTDWKGKLDYSYWGPQIYLVARY